MSTRKKDPTLPGERIVIPTTWQVIRQEDEYIVLKNCDGGKTLDSRQVAAMRLSAEKLSDLYARSLKK